MDDGREAIDGRRHILLVKDNEHIRETICEMLADLGYRVSCADGGKAMRAYLEGDDYVDAVLLDVILPGEHGSSLASFVSGLELPAVLMSGALPEIAAARQNGEQLLIKPFGQSDLAAALAVAFRERPE